MTHWTHWKAFELLPAAPPLLNKSSGQTKKAQVTFTFRLKKQQKQIEEPLGKASQSEQQDTSSVAHFTGDFARVV